MRTVMTALLGLAMISAQPAGAQQWTDEKIAVALQGNAWCRFTYNQISGYSRNEKAAFGRDGVLRVSRSGEGVSSGQNGSVFSQSSGQDAYQWRVRGLQLQLGQDGEWETFDLDSKVDGSGKTLLFVGRDEWFAC